VTDAPLAALVPISISTLPDEATVLDISQRSSTPLPETTILSTGSMRPRITMPLIVPDALPAVNVLFQFILVLRAPLHCTVPLPMTVACVDHILLDKSVMMLSVAIRIREFIYV